MKFMTLKNGNNILENIQPGLFYTKLNRFYSSPTNGTTLTTATLAANTLYALPFITPIEIKIDSARAVVTTLGTGSILKAGIYKDLNLYPDVLFSDFGSQSGATTGLKIFTEGLPLTMPSGLYWLTVTATVGLIVRGFTSSQLLPILGYDSNLNTIAGLGYSILNASGNLPSIFPANASIRQTVPLPMLGIRPF